LVTPLKARWSRRPSSPNSPKRRPYDGRRHAGQVASNLLAGEALSELGDHEEAEGGVRVLGLAASVDQPASRWAIEPEYLVHGKVSSMSVAGLATATIDGLTFPFNFLPAIRDASADLESRTVV
jgi:hypothetical protein